jgi:hypothetical protein
MEKHILKVFAAHKYKGESIFKDTGISEILLVDPSNKLKEHIYEQIFRI